MRMNDVGSRIEATSGPTGDWFEMKAFGEFIVRIVSELYPYIKSPFKGGGNPRNLYLCRIINRDNGKIEFCYTQS